MPARVLLTADAVGGVWQYSLDLARALARRGAQVLIATCGPRPTARPKFRGAQFAESDYALEWMPNPWRDVDAAGSWLLELASAFHPDIVHLGGYSHAALRWPCPVLVVAHSCVFSWWRAVHGCAPGPDWDEYARRVRAGLNAADAVIAPSQYMADALAYEHGVPLTKIRVIHNFSRAPHISYGRKESLIVAAGRVWDEAKNVALLDRIAPDLAWPVHIAGAGRAPVPHRELLQLMRRASIFAHPALYEPFGLGVLEAARSGCCLALADIPSLRELWQDAAFFINPRDPDAWRRELTALAQNSSRREALAAAAQARSRSLRTNASIDAYWRLYETLIQQACDSRTEAA